MGLSRHKKNSKGVIGYNEYNGYYYIHLDDKGDYYVTFSSNKPNLGLLVPMDK